MLALQIFPIGGTEGQNFGVAVSLSASNIAVGASGDSSGTGALFMYGFDVRGPADFSFPLITKLVPSVLTSGALFGSSVAMYEGFEVSTPETPLSVTVVGGAPGASGGEGLAFIYYAPDASVPVWSSLGSLSPSGSGVTSFGQSVALYLDTMVRSG